MDGKQNGGQVYVLMGVSGSGKTTVGLLLAEHLSCPFYDGDDYHPPENVAKMAAGIPLDDEDRYPWLARLQNLAVKHLRRGEQAIIACSALKKKYRDLLRPPQGDLRFIYLQGDFETLWQRMSARQDHYMKAGMLRSQFETLEVPDSSEALTVPVDTDVESILTQILQAIDSG